MHILYGDLPAPDGALDMIEAWEPPLPKAVKPRVQVARIIEALQDEGLIGIVPRTEILRRYPEHCEMLGFLPIGTNLLLECMARKAKRVRPLVDGQRITAYVIPPPTRADDKPTSLPAIQSSAQVIPIKRAQVAQQPRMRKRKVA